MWKHSTKIQRSALKNVQRVDYTKFGNMIIDLETRQLNDFQPNLVHLG